MRISLIVLTAIISLALLAFPAYSHGTVLPAGTGSPPVVAPATQTKVSRFALPATAVDGIGVAELSGLAWDPNARLLYAVSDQGHVYRFRVRVEDDTLTAVEPVAAAALVDPVTGEGRAESGKHFNAEGLALQHAANGASALIIALEEDPPAIGRFSPDGTLLATLAVPKPANAAANYAKSKKGEIKRGLEAVALHPVHGLLTAPESPLIGHPAGLHTVFANGRQWSFTRYAPGSRLKGLDVLPDGNLLVLERSRQGPSKHVLVATLRTVDITACEAGNACTAKLLAALPPGPESFEGATLLDARHVLLASDNGGDPAQSTTFSLVTLP